MKIMTILYTVDYTVGIQNFTVVFDNYENNFNIQFNLKV